MLCAIEGPLEQEAFLKLADPRHVVSSRPAENDFAESSTSTRVPNFQHCVSETADGPTTSHLQPEQLQHILDTLGMLSLGMEGEACCLFISCMHEDLHLHC